MKQIITQRDADTEPLQDINYVYDAVGNIVYVKDNAQQTFYFDNSIIQPESFYTYDALYRLIEATGRENFNNTGFYEVTTPQGLGGNDIQNYERSFEYDLVGNITKMQHAASANSFTKHFHYDNDNNQLTRIFIGNSLSALESYTYDEHGNMLASNDRQFTYNLLDQLQVVDITGGSWKAFYMYNAEGQRDRKTVNNIAGTKDRIYFQNLELYREYDNADDLVLERYTHHITDGEKKVVQWDTPTTLPSGSGEVETIRYQYSNVLQSVGLELDQNADIVIYEEYYPFGGTAYYAHNSAIDVPLKRYKYCGKEQDEETGMYYYGARYYLPWLCRFSSVDPKALEYIHQSSYVFADNNPVVKYDVNGEGTNGDGCAAENQPQAWHPPMAAPKQDNELSPIWWVEENNNNLSESNILSVSSTDTNSSEINYDNKTATIKNAHSSIIKYKDGSVTYSFSNSTVNIDENSVDGIKYYTNITYKDNVMVKLEKGIEKFSIKNPEEVKVDNESEVVFDMLTVAGGVLAIGAAMTLAPVGLVVLGVLSGSMAISVGTVKYIGHTFNDQNINDGLDKLPTNYSGMLAMPIDAARGDDNYTFSKIVGSGEDILGLRLKGTPIDGKKFEYEYLKKPIDNFNAFKGVWDQIK